MELGLNWLLFPLSRLNSITSIKASRRFSTIIVDFYCQCFSGQYVCSPGGVLAVSHAGSLVLMQIPQKLLWCGGDGGFFSFFFFFKLVLTSCLVLMKTCAGVDSLIPKSCECLLC